MRDLVRWWWWRAAVALGLRRREAVSRYDYPGPWSVDADPFDREGFAAALEARNRRVDEWVRRENAFCGFGEGRPCG